MANRCLFATAAAAALITIVTRDVSDIATDS